MPRPVRTHGLGSADYPFTIEWTRRVQRTDIGLRLQCCGPWHEEEADLRVGGARNSFLAALICLDAEFHVGLAGGDPDIANQNVCKGEGIISSGYRQGSSFTDGIQAALDGAKEAANGKDIQLGGGISTMKQYLRAGPVDDMHVVISPALIGSGERLFQDLDLPDLALRLPSTKATG